MSLANGISFVKQMIKLIKTYSTNINMTPNEFITGIITEDISKPCTDLCENFLLLMKYYKIFESLVGHFWQCYKLKKLNKEIIITLMYIIIFLLEEETLPDCKTIFTEYEFKYCRHVVEFFTVEENIIDLTQAGCRIFDNDYVLKNILNPIINNSSLLEDLLTTINKALTNTQLIIRKSLTKPITPRCLRKSTKISAPPVNSFAEIQYFKSKAIPKQVLKTDLKLKRNLEKAHQENREKAKKLLRYARDNAFNCAKYSHKNSAPMLEIQESFRIKHTKIPPRKDIIIKPNAASLLREAATYAKDKENEIKKIEALTQSFFDPSILDKLEKKIRKCKEQDYLQEIERKHLQGLLSHEESILAKRNLLKENQMKMEQFKEERLEILDEINLWKENEQEKIKALVEKCQGIEKAAKEAEKKLHYDKKINARLIENETKQLLKQAYEKQREDLACKVQLIEELRALQQVRTLQVKEFDPTESPNFGFLCEMSIAELQERLALLKMEMQQELDKRRGIIAENRQKQQQLIESIKQFISQNRVTKPKPLPRATPKLEQTPDLIALRERLEQAKCNRIAMQQFNVHY